MSKLKEYKEVSIEEIKEVEEFKNFIPENNMYDKIKEDIAKNGIKVPLIVNQNYELINGYTRLKIARELGIKEVPVAVYETEGRADEYDLLVSTNLTQRQLSRAQALALIEKAVEEKTRLLKKSNISENKIGEQKVERVPVQLSESQDKKIQSLTDLRNAVKEELKKYNVRVDDRTLDYYIRIKENAPWLTDYILKGKLGIYPAYSIYTKLQEMGLLEAVAKLPPYERNSLLTDGRKIILDGRKDLLEEIVNHRMAVSQAINKLKTEEKLKKAKKKPKAKEDIEREEEDEGEEDETIDREDSESDNDEYDLVGEWQRAKEEEEKQLTPQFNEKDEEAPPTRIVIYTPKADLDSLYKAMPSIKKLVDEGKLTEKDAEKIYEIWRNMEAIYKQASLLWYNTVNILLKRIGLSEKEREEIFYEMVRPYFRLFSREEVFPKEVLEGKL
ncbi:ParB N-terminal domain-containing protein [Saccharolobus islandicus]|uniref:ParB domain protein nuclease n=1 Tax=Saccharolobus islandicus (strain M.16.4 / Kamchatka \|nr:ParB N-terminal domain-containing protein [Sulfolobus islandicus]ACR42231.1 ParB domain protein nuclease [Sulfolobus islandicus M.16.4]